MKEREYKAFMGKRPPNMSLRNALDIMSSSFSIPVRLFGFQILILVSVQVVEDVKPVVSVQLFLAKP